VVAGEAGVQGSPARSHLIARWPVRIFSEVLPGLTASFFMLGFGVSQATVSRYLTCTKPAVETVVANLS
jgi:hypothetical protein